MSDTNAPEPTMEEILASIRRIISEDDAPAASEHTPPAATPEANAHPAAASEPDEDVLELTEPLDSPRPLSEPVAQPGHQAPSASLGDLELSTPTPPPEPSSIPKASPPIASSYDGLLVSGATADAAASAFSQLTGSTMLPPQGRTLEDMVREMLRPLLKDWLDANLPAIVESTVRAEVERIARSRVY